MKIVQHLILGSCMLILTACNHLRSPKISADTLILQSNQTTSKTKTVSTTQTSKAEQTAAEERALKELAIIHPSHLASTPPKVTKTNEVITNTTQTKQKQELERALLPTVAATTQTVTTTPTLKTPTQTVSNKSPITPHTAEPLRLTKQWTQHIATLKPSMRACFYANRDANSVRYAAPSAGNHAVIILETSDHRQSECLVNTSTLKIEKLTSSQHTFAKNSPYFYPVGRHAMFCRNGLMQRDREGKFIGTLCTS